MTSSDQTCEPARGGDRDLSACWRGKGPPRLKRVWGVRACPHSLGRSEERRVGEEGSARWAGDQAEDGIRDRNVTGVQTCALPILVSYPRDWDSGGKLPVIPDDVFGPNV